MKKIINMIFASMLLLATGCSQPEYDELGALPDASTIDVTATCNQETNIVTFTSNSTGMLPVWFFDDGEVSSATVVEKLYTNAGTYEVEVKAMDQNGMSENSQTLSFTLENTYVDEALMTALCGTLDGSKSWVWNKDNAGHFGCDDTGSSTGYGWWAAGANSQSDDMYDDVMTFSASGAYSYSPGDGGKIAVNADVTLTTFTDSYADGLSDATATNGTWSFVYDGDTTYIQLSEYMLAGYMPFDSFYADPTFKIASISDDLLVLIADNNSWISWRFEFIPQAQE